MRLIDAFALEARMYHDAFETDSDMQKWDGGCWIRYKMFENAIADAPTIEERKTGKWIPGRVLSKSYIGDACVGIDYEDWRCSQCGVVIEEPFKPPYNYCPHCGARMES